MRLVKDVITACDILTIRICFYYYLTMSSDLAKSISGGQNMDEKQGTTISVMETGAEGRLRCVVPNAEQVQNTGRPQEGCGTGSLEYVYAGDGRDAPDSAGGGVSHPADRQRQRKI